LLVARGDNFTQGQQYFHQAVILMLEHDEKGSMGVILNRPTQYSMGYVSGDESGPFSENALYFGGDVGDGTVSFLHGSSSVSGSVEVSNGVFLGGYESACELVKQGEVEANDCKFFARYCGWGPGQLKSECERGVWYPVACSKQIALKQVIQLPKPLWREVSELVGGDVGYESRKAYGEATKEDAEKYGDGDDE
jgi:putative transcriptional regulator